MSKTNLTRRAFMGGTLAMGGLLTASCASFGILKSRPHAKGRYASPASRLNIACIGVGGMGRTDTENVGETENIVALCDIDSERAAESREKFPGAAFHDDFRKLLEKHGKEIDAVTISTPDHTHAPIALVAMAMGKHVRIQKPLAVTIEEAFALRDAARSHGVVACMGIQGHSSEGARRLCEWIWQGAIGEVTEVVYWTNRPIWPQGNLAGKINYPAVPKTVNWKSWLGPSAHQEYSPDIHPFKWRGWWDYGTGALGDIGCHSMDAAYWALDIEAPQRVLSVESVANTQMWAPEQSTVVMEMRRRGGRPPVKFTWMDGGRLPERPADLEPDREIDGGDMGQLFIGTKGKIIADIYCGSPRLVPETSMKEWMASEPRKFIPRSPGTYKEFIEACKGGEMPGADLEYSARLTEACLMGCAAIRHGGPLDYDSDRRLFTNAPEANKYLSRAYKGDRTLDEALRREFA